MYHLLKYINLNCSLFVYLASTFIVLLRLTQGTTDFDYAYMYITFVVISFIVFNIIMFVDDKRKQIDYIKYIRCSKDEEVTRLALDTMCVSYLNRKVYDKLYNKTISKIDYKVRNNVVGYKMYLTQYTSFYYVNYGVKLCIPNFINFAYLLTLLIISV